MKYLFFIVFCIVFSFSKNVEANNNSILYPKILVENDKQIYKKIFIIQNKLIKNRNANDWKQVDKLIKKLNNKIILGNVFSQRYLHSTGWRSKYSELSNWLNNYNDHADATKI